MENYTRKLASFCSSLNYESIPKKVLEKTKWVILDNLGVILGASLNPVGKEVAAFVKGLGDRKEATVLGFGFKSSTRNAAFVNGTLSEILEFQDGYAKGGIHPSSGVIPAALAVAEHHRKSGKDLLTSIVAGYEVANRVSEAIHPSHGARGFLATGTIGTIGASAAVGKIMGFDTDRMFNAIGAAGFILPITTQGSHWGGGTIKEVQGGAAAKVGIESAMLAQRGITACALEGEPKMNKGFCVLVSDKQNFEKIIEGLGEKYTMEEIYFKPYACCRMIHAAVENILDLAKRNQIRPEDVESILVKTFTYAVSTVGQVRVNPESIFILCQFSTQYCLAVALIDGKVGPAQFSPERIRDEKIFQLASRVSIISDPEMDQLRTSVPDTRPAIVEITLKNGQKLTGRVEYPKGDPRKPMSEGELLEKFEGLASSILTQKKIKKVESLVLGLEKADVVELIQSCS